MIFHGIVWKKENLLSEGRGCLMNDLLKHFTATEYLSDRAPDFPFYNDNMGSLYFTIYNIPILNLTRNVLGSLT